MDALWGESPPRTAVHVLHVYVSDLRRSLPDEVLVTAPPGYLLRVPTGAVDLADFERLVSRGREALSAGDPADAAVLLDDALALWRGPVLEDLAGEGFVQVEARRLEELRLEARELRAMASLARGGAPDLVPQLLELVSEHPFRERPHALLMRALAVAGRQAEALEVYATVRARLADELGIEPGAELRSAQTAVLRQEAAPARPVTPAGVVLAVGCDPRRLDALALVASASRRRRGAGTPRRGRARCPHVHPSGPHRDCRSRPDGAAIHPWTGAQRCLPFPEPGRPRDGLGGRARRRPGRPRRRGTDSRRRDA